MTVVYKLRGKITKNSRIINIIQNAPGFNNEGIYNVDVTLTAINGASRVYKWVDGKWMDASLQDLHI